VAVCAGVVKKKLDPENLVESDTSGGEAAHKPGSLKKKG
jgi:hypothetical protein